ncbi:hypothetical protein RU97_GL000698 [Enterococcus canis]|uniref:Uncharacterized protein n=1 Tax=Enterococcus canis TaxID=214095 RepID=A0A1L8RHA8_9ENTE|nr:hypothetical protein RU97_GL000698 [Enterococcus canis]
MHQVEVESICAACSVSEKTIAAVKSAKTIIDNKNFFVIN